MSAERTRHAVATALQTTTPDVHPADVALEMAVYLISSLAGVDSGPHVYALGQASNLDCLRSAWLDLTTIVLGIERKLGPRVAIAALEHARRAVRR